MLISVSCLQLHSGSFGHNSHFLFTLKIWFMNLTYNELKMQLCFIYIKLEKKGKKKVNTICLVTLIKNLLHMKRYQRHEQYIWARCDGNMFLKCRLGWLDDTGNAGFWRRKSGWKIPVVLWFYPSADWRCKNLRLGHQTTQLTLSLPLTLTPFRERERAVSYTHLTLPTRRTV